MANSDSRDLTQLNGSGKESEVKVKIEPEVQIKIEPEVQVKLEPEVQVKLEPEVQVKVEPEVEDKVEVNVQFKVEYDVDDSPYAEIIVIRHGETEWNACGKIQGHLDVELNDVGIEQAETVANRLSKESKISAVYSSDLKRAFVTAEKIASICGAGEVIKDKNLRERHLGDLQGTVYGAAPEVCPEAYKAFISPLDQEIPGGGESLKQLYDRGTSTLQKIADKHIGETVAVVSHGGLIRALYRRSVSTVKCGKVLNTSVNVFHITKGGSWTIKNWCDVSHLKQTEFLEAGFGGDKNSG